jgi:hypothetical protein
VTVETVNDLVQATFEPPAGAADKWHEDAEFDVDYSVLADLYVCLFTEPEFLLARFTLEQLDAGFGAMINCNYQLAVSELVWDRTVPIEKREGLIASMVQLYARFFRRQSFVYSTYMWWDVIAYSFECGNAIRGRSQEETRLQDAMFISLVQILTIDSPECQEAALHGIGHLHHPEGERAIEFFIESTPGISRELHAYAAQAALGMIK